MKKKHFVVIGGGLAGTLICNQLVKHAEVTLLEAGFKDTILYPEVKYLKKNFGAVKTFCIGGGGTTNLWHNGLIPLNPIDIHLNHFRAILEDARAYTDQAASRLYFTYPSFSHEYARLQSELNAHADNAGLSIDGVDCLIYPKKFRRLEADERVNAIYGAEDIDFDLRSSRRVDAVRYSVNGGRRTVVADGVILSAGTIGTPRLVQRLLGVSGIELDVAGKGLADHPMGFVGKLKASRKTVGLFRMLSSLDRGDYVCRSALRIKSRCGKYTGCAFFRPALTMENKLDLYKYKSRLGASKGMERVKNIFSPKIFHPDILAEIYAHLLGVNIRSRIYNILVIFEQKRGDNRVIHDRKGLTVDWGITDAEMKIYNDMLAKLSDHLRPFCEQLVVEVPITDDWLWSAAHHSGTVALDSPEAGGLIDRNLKMHALDNVHICDGSVIQEHSYANTGLTIGQLAMRLSDHLLKSAD